MDANTIRQVIRWYRKKNTALAELDIQKFFIICHKEVTNEPIVRVRLETEVKDFNDRGIIPYYVVICMKKNVFRSLVCR